MKNTSLATVFLGLATSLTALAIAALTPVPAEAAQPSFRCTGKLTANERLICQSGDLAAWDQEMALTYGELTSLLNRAAADIVRSDQRQFLRARQRCRANYRCTRERILGRLNQLKAHLAEEQSFRNPPPSNQNNGNQQGGGFFNNNSSSGGGQNLSGTYVITVLANGADLRVDAEADKLLFSTLPRRDTGVASHRFQIVKQGGVYQIFDGVSGLALHADGNGDRQVSLRYQPQDDFTRFRITPANLGCYFIQTVATGRYWTWQQGAQTVFAGPNPNGENSMFCLEK